LKLISYLFISITFIFSNEYKISQIIDENTFIIKTNDNINPNKTLFVLSAQNHISALGKIINKNNNTYKITILEKNPFKNKNIPYLKYKLNTKDKIIDKLFDNNVMIISPDFQNYQKVKNKFKNKNFLNPDLLVAFASGSKNITKKEFFSFAKQYNCSYYYFVFNDGIYIKDAFNLKTIKIIKQNINHKTNKHQFFNNIQESYSSINFSFKNDSFDEYYKDITK
jgi:hypothetical protein